MAVIVCPRMGLPHLCSFSSLRRWPKSSFTWRNEPGPGSLLVGRVLSEGKGTASVCSLPCAPPSLLYILHSVCVWGGWGWVPASCWAYFIGRAVKRERSALHSEKFSRRRRQASLVMGNP